MGNRITTTQTRKGGIMLFLAGCIIVAGAVILWACCAIGNDRETDDKEQEKFLREHGKR